MLPPVVWRSTAAEQRRTRLDRSCSSNRRSELAIGPCTRRARERRRRLSDCHPPDKARRLRTFGTAVKLGPRASLEHGFRARRTARIRRGSVGPLGAVPTLRASCISEIPEDSRTSHGATTRRHRRAAHYSLLPTSPLAFSLDRIRDLVGDFPCKVGTAPRSVASGAEASARRAASGVLLWAAKPTRRAPPKCHERVGTAIIEKPSACAPAAVASSVYFFPTYGLW